MDQLTFTAFVFWPGVVLICAAINMVVSRTFSRAELQVDYIAGAVAGWFLFHGTRPGADEVDKFFLIFSQGFFGILWESGVFSSAEQFFLIAGVYKIVATWWAARSDKKPRKTALRSLFTLPAKLPFAIFTTAVGLTIWIVAKLGKRKTRFVGGIFLSEFRPGGRRCSAVSLGATVHTWYGDTPLEHELYHSRQYIYLGDWLIPFWLLGLPWGMRKNPLEVAAYRL